MHLKENGVYHIYNRGINKQLIFNDREDYFKFLCLVRDHITPISDILSFCLMPNHFHFLIAANERSIIGIERGTVKSQHFSYSLSIMLSAYSQYFNKRYSRTGSLFSKGTKSKDVSFNPFGISFSKYLSNCMHYIHQNPLRAGLVNKLEEWEFSSFKDYAGFRNGTLCNKSLLMQLADINDDFYIRSYEIIEVDLPG